MDPTMEDTEAGRAAVKPSSSSTTMTTGSTHRPDLLGNDETRIADDGGGNGAAGPPGDADRSPPRSPVKTSRVVERDEFTPEPSGKENDSNKRPRLDGCGAMAPGRADAVPQVTPADAADPPAEGPAAAAAAYAAFMESESEFFRPWQELMEMGGRAKRILKAAMDQVHDSADTIVAAATAAAPAGDGSGVLTTASRAGEGEPPSQGKGERLDGEARDVVGLKQHWTVAEMARDKTELVLKLERQLVQAQSQRSALEASNAALRDENRNQQARLDKTVRALRIAGQNAAKARKDASDAESTAAGLASQVQTFQSVVNDTKHTVQALRDEHRKVTDDVRKVEARLVQALAQNAATSARYRRLEQRHAALEAEASESRRDAAAWQARHEKATDSIADLERNLDRANEHQSARRAHSEQLAKEHQQALVLLEASTRANDASDRTLRDVRDASRTLGEEVTRLTGELSEHRTKSQLEKDRLNESYTNALSKAQHFELQVETIKASLAAKEQEWERERTTLMSKARASSTTPASATGIVSGSASSSSSSATPSLQALSRIPPLSSFRSSTFADAGRDPDRSARPAVPPLGSATATTTTTPKATAGPAASAFSDAATCCVCHEPAVLGMIKTCQCGRRDRCPVRAHAACVPPSNPRSGSAPLILCGGGGGGEHGSSVFSLLGGGSSSSNNNNNILGRPSRADLLD